MILVQLLCISSMVDDLENATWKLGPSKPFHVILGQELVIVLDGFFADLLIDLANLSNELVLERYFHPTDVNRVLKIYWVCERNIIAP